ncbi:MAG: putative ABC transporter permease [Candidatus Ventricola sp.]
MMRIEIENTVLLFFACAFLGWVMEVLCQLVQFRRFINRGFLIGPYCPIYGFGAVLVCRLLSRFASDPLAVFALALLVCGTLEYITSYAMEKLFHARWWDYSQKPFNLNGRICAGTLIPFGLLGLIIVYRVKPFFFGVFSLLSAQVRSALCAVLSAAMLLDLIVSMQVLSKIRIAANLNHADNTESITLAVREKLIEQGRLVRRTLRAFPYARLYSNQLLLDMKAERLRLKAEARQKTLELRQEINSREEALRQDIRRLKASRK